MKACPYCGKEYPEEATTCVIDNWELSDPAIDRKKATGVWRGVYGYSENLKMPGREPAAFTLKLKQGWTDHFTGTITEDPPVGLPGMGNVDGYFTTERIEFTKQMPVGYVPGTNCDRMTLREYIISKGHPCEHEPPSPPIFYQGAMLDGNRVQGTWIINSHRLRVADGSYLSFPGLCGFWCAQFVMSDLRIDAAGGPTAPLFDKALLTTREIEEVEGVPFTSIGKFNVMDAENYLDRFWQQDIRFQLHQDDTAIRQMPEIAAVTSGNSGLSPLVEISVHPDDEQKAMEIVNQDNRV